MIGLVRNRILLGDGRVRTAANLELVDSDHRESRLKFKLEEVRHNYSYILIDCPPALDLLTLNALVAADSVLIPIQCEFFALEGISQLIDTVEGIRESFEHHLAIELAETLNAKLAPVRERRAQFDPASVDAILARGSEKARMVANETMRAVRAAMKLT